jgi:hypothetical protein
MQAYPWRSASDDDVRRDDALHGGHHAPDLHDASAREQELALIISGWDALSQEQPWHVAPHRYGLDSFHETISAILDVRTWGTLGPFTVERLVRSAAAHGEQRRAQGVPDDALFREYHALRAAIWRYLQLVAPRNSAAVADMLRVDVAIGVATTLALRGYHRTELPPGVSWEMDVLDQIKAVTRNLADQLHEGEQA